MKFSLPVNIPAMIKTAQSLSEVAATPISISLYFDETAPGALIAHVRSLFTTESSSVRLSANYLDDSSAVPIHSGDDFAVIVAGTLPTVGRVAASLREDGVPVMIVTADPDRVGLLAQNGDAPIPNGDLLAPKILEDGATEGAVDPLAPEVLRSVDDRMGRWVTATCSTKRLAAALAFPFVRHPLASDMVMAASVENAGIGVVHFIPGADMPLMTLNQARLLLGIATAYGQPLGKERIIELAMVVGGGFVFRGLARQLTSIIPILGWAIKGAIGFSGTQAMGQAAIEYFENGGDIRGFAGVIQKARDGVVSVASSVAASPAGQAVKSKVKSLVAGNKKLFYDVPDDRP